jgi:hypothetical protein
VIDKFVNFKCVFLLEVELCGKKDEIVEILNCAFGLEVSPGYSTFFNEDFNCGNYGKSWFFWYLIGDF